VVQHIYQQDRIGRRPARSRRFRSPLLAAKLLFMLLYMGLSILLLCTFAAGVSSDWLINRE
jgi:hypothetical protein